MPRAVLVWALLWALPLAHGVFLVERAGLKVSAWNGGLIE